MKSILDINIFSSRINIPRTKNLEPRTLVPQSLSPLFFLLAILLLISCSPKKLAVQQLTIERDGQIIATVNAEIAANEEDRAKGLMHRKELPEGDGMLFVYDSDHIMKFWMKNTLIPLSIAYISSDGKIVDIKNMYPHDENPVVSSRSVRYALEVPQGWFIRAGVSVGDRVRVEELGIRN